MQDALHGDLMFLRHHETLHDRILLLSGIDSLLLANACQHLSGIYIAPDGLSTLRRPEVLEIELER